MVGTGPHKASGEGFSEEMPYCRLQREDAYKSATLRQWGNDSSGSSPCKDLEAENPRLGAFCEVPHCPGG